MAKISENSLFNAIIDAMKTHSGTETMINWYNGPLECFLFDGMWFPLRKTVNHARHLQGLRDADNTECRRNLKEVLRPLDPFIRTVTLNANELNIATFADQVEGRKRKWEAINALNAKEQLIQGYS